MSYELAMTDEGILRMAFIGDVDIQDIEAAMKEAEPFLAAVPESGAMPMLSDVSRAGKLTSDARKGLASMGTDPRMGKSAIIGVSRYQRVVASFVIKASGQDNMRFFDSEEEALVWLRGDG
jgi:hypothetical protein